MFEDFASLLSLCTLPYYPTTIYPTHRVPFHFLLFERLFCAK